MALACIALRITTKDGWSLCLRRVAARNANQAPPVLMLHGFGANGFCLWRESGPSLATHLAAAGRVAWVLDHRGTRSSSPARRSAFQRITASDKLAFDLPAAVQTVLEEEGAAALDLVGHSLGGTLAYHYLTGESRGQVRRAVTFAAAMRYELPPGARLLAALGGARLDRVLGWAPIPISAFTRLGASTGIVRPAHDHFNLANVERDTLLAMMRYGTENACLTELLELARSAELGEAGPRRNGGLSSLGDLALERIRAPMLMIGGSADRHVRVQDLQATWQRIGAPAKRLIVIGPATGAATDYGHTDLLLGPRASREVFPHVSAWLDGPEPGAVR